MDTEIYDKAHTILKSRRDKAQAENDRRMQEINSRIPEIKEINDTLFNTGKELIRVISQGKNVSAEIEKIKQRNMGAQNLAKQLLISHGYPADYLDMHYTCPYCNDTGYIENQFCDCMKSLFGKLMSEKMNENAHLALSVFETFSLKYYKGDDYYIMQRILNYTREYAENFKIDSDNIIMTGETGLGKTHLSLSIANVVLQKGFSVIYDSVINILWNIEREHFSYEHSSDVLNTVLDADLLILDDLGTEQETKFYNSMIYNIINTRLVKQKPTIISTNLDRKAMSARYGGKVASRISTLFKYLQFQGDDIRLQIFVEKKNR
ncbi:MAG: ATP-binding protein [Ruminococcus flavefaciens]|nr:ATP-binding protein [Ruminococcus flavefaciens]MCM1229902.1 ATP-binding protein [Ruminococcus flavefaciens]